MPFRQSRYCPGEEPRPLRRQPSKNPLQASSAPAPSSVARFPAEAAPPNRSNASPLRSLRRLRHWYRSWREMPRSRHNSATFAAAKAAVAQTPGTPSYTSDTSDHLQSLHSLQTVKILSVSLSGGSPMACQPPLCKISSHALHSVAHILIAILQVISTNSLHFSQWRKVTKMRAAR